MSARFEQQAPAGSAPVIQGYTASGGFRVSGRQYVGAVLVTPTRVIDWPVAGLDDLNAESFALLGEEPIEIILLGTGPALRRPAKPAMDAFAARGLVIELMDSKAAARTYTMLANEGRLVVAALLPL